MAFPGRAGLANCWWNRSLKRNPLPTCEASARIVSPKPVGTGTRPGAKPRESMKLTMESSPRLQVVILAILSGLLPLTAAASTPTKTENIFLITIDGFRWQDVFTGAEALLMNRTNGGVANADRLRRAFWRDTPEERRQTLLPFFWSVIARQGQLYGNAHQGSVARVTNEKRFTYPGFNEILTGFADERIDKNEKRNNSNVTVLEWLHQKPAFTNRVVALANWDVFPYILNTERSGIPMWTGFETNWPFLAGPRFAFVDQLLHDTTPLWPDMTFDSFFFHAAREYTRQHKPRLVWIAFSEPDEWAHEGRYDRYLVAANKIDGYVRALW